MKVNIVRRTTELPVVYMNVVPNGWFVGKLDHWDKLQLFLRVDDSLLSFGNTVAVSIYDQWIKTPRDFPIHDYRKVSPDITVNID